MPMPKPKDPQDESSEGKPLTVGGKPVKKLVKLVKPYKADMPDIANRMAELAAKAAGS
jgi:hypothetical protein